MNYAVIGGGMSGLSIANILKDTGHSVIVFEKEERPGGMIKCDMIDGCLFHRTGGHVFNTKRQDVLEWFWKHFDADKEFTKAYRNSSVVFEDKVGIKNIAYPIENHMYCFDEQIQKRYIADMLTIATERGMKEPQNFDEFLRQRFGNTLYEMYFEPYNHKVWRRDLTKVPLSWLAGKLPMPTVEEMIFNNMNHIEEHQFVHSSFYYPIKEGSQFLANRLSKGIQIIYNHAVTKITRHENKWLIEGQAFDKVVFCGNIKELPVLLANNVDIDGFIRPIEELESHGTTSVFCKIDSNPYSWIYLPDKRYEAHRIICTGNFSPNNNSKGMLTGTVEFTDYISKNNILDNLSRLPYHPQYITHNYEKYTYPIQKPDTRTMIKKLKTVLEPAGFYLLGRFAEWEYYNMDIAIGASIDLVNKTHLCND